MFFYILSIQWLKCGAQLHNLRAMYLPVLHNYNEVIVF